MICSTEPPPVHCLKMQLKSESQSKSIEREQTHTKNGPGLPNRLLELGLFSQFYRSEVADLSVNGHCDLDVQSVIPNLSLSAPASYQHSILLILSTQIKLFGNENNANDHTEQFI